jgi:hypothetical protein
MKRAMAITAAVIAPAWCPAQKIALNNPNGVGDPDVAR